MGTEGLFSFDQQNQCLEKVNLLNLVDLDSYKYLQRAPVLVAGTRSRSIPKLGELGRRQNNTGTTIPTATAPTNLRTGLLIV